MRILLVNPPNCGRSIPEERYGITSIKQIFRGEPLGLEVLAGNLAEHEVEIVDLKAEPDAWPEALFRFDPELVALTGMACEANTVVRLAEEAKKANHARVVVGGIHASSDPGFFNRAAVDFVVVGLGKASLLELVSALEAGADPAGIPGVARTSGSGDPAFQPRDFSPADLVESMPPRYDLVDQYREQYTLESLNLKMGHVASSLGCPHHCPFCSITHQTGGAYLPASPSAVLRDIRLLGDIPVIRLVDANTFGSISESEALCRAIEESGIRKHYIADVRSDTVVEQPGLFEAWKAVGLRAVVIGLEEISGDRLKRFGKKALLGPNKEAIDILHGIGVTVVGDFIVSPDYSEADFAALEAFVLDSAVDLPMLSILTPLPGTALFRAMDNEIVIRDLDYYTLTNAVLPTRIPEEVFYSNYARLLKTFHANSKV